MMRKARRYHAVRALAVAVLLVLLGWGGYEVHGRLQAHALRGRLLDANTNEVPTIVEDIAGITLKRRYNLNAPKGVNGRNSDNTRIKARLGWAPSIRLRDGLERNYAWIYDRVAQSQAVPVA